MRGLWKSGGLPLLLLVSAAALSAKNPVKLDLQGNTIPSLRWGVVWVAAADGSFHKRGVVRNGRFLFKKITPGSYVVSVFHPRWGLTERTFQLLERYADRGRMRIGFLMEDSDSERTRALKPRSIVSFRELSVSPKARAEYKNALDNLSKGHEEKAIAHLQKAVAISPQFAEAWQNLGTAFYNADNYEKAEECYRQALYYHGESFHANVNLAASLIELDRVAEALNYSIFAQTLRPDSPLANSQLGMSYYHLKQDQKALDYLTRAKRSDPGHFTHPQKYLARIHFRQGRHRDALRELEDLLRRHPALAGAEEVMKTAERVKQAMGAP